MCVAGGGAGPILLAMLGSIFGGMSILKHGSEEQKRKYLPKICTGEMLVYLGVTEPDAATNTLNIRTFARKDGDDYETCTFIQFKFMENSAFKML